MTIVTKNKYIIPLSFVIAFILTLLPMPGLFIWLKPAWILMVLIFWAMTLPETVNVGIAWIVGIFLDVLESTLLGEHALALTLVTYLVVRMHSRLYMFPVLQQSLCIFLFVLLYQFILFCIKGFLGTVPSHWLYWSSALTSMILWPWISITMREQMRSLAK